MGFTSNEINQTGVMKWIDKIGLIIMRLNVILTIFFMIGSVLGIIAFAGLVGGKGK